MQQNGPQLLKIRGDKIKTKTAFRCYICLVTAMLIFFFIVSMRVPHSLEEFESKQNCDSLTSTEKMGHFCNTLDLDQSDTWTSYFMDISEYNQFLYVRTHPILKGTQATDNSIEGNQEIEVDEKLKLVYTLKVSHVNNKGEVTTIAWDEIEKTKVIECDIKKSKHPNQDQLDHFCKPFSIFVEPELLVGNYRVDMVIKNRLDMEKYFSGFVFDAFKINEQYSEFVVGIRYLFFLVSLIVAIGYCINFSASPSHLRVFEQKYIILLVVGLCLFNDPFVGINIISPSKFR